jgi:hypothetical protein
VAEKRFRSAPLCKQVPGTGHDGAAVIPGRGAGTCGCRDARERCGVSYRGGFWIRGVFVHPGTQNPPVSPNTPR